MRGYASQAVVVFHLFAISAILRGMWFAKIPLAWNSGVDFFFVLSGFLLSIPFLQGSKADDRRRQKGPSKLKQYFIKRAFRILPVYYLSLAGTLLFFSRGATWQEIASSIFFLQNFNPNTFDQINGVYWTLVIEEIFYATLPLFVIFFRGRRWTYALPVCIAISTFYRVIVSGLFVNNLFLENFYLWQYPSYIEHFAIGATLGNIFVNRGIFAGKFDTNQRILGVIALIIATQYISGLFYNENGYNFSIANLIFALEYSGLIYYTLSSPLTSWIRWIFSNGFAQYLGKISYSTYVWHLPIQATLYLLKLPLIEWVLMSYSLAITLSVASYYLVERPFLRLRYRLVPPETIRLPKKAVDQGGEKGNAPSGPVPPPSLPR